MVSRADSQSIYLGQAMDDVFKRTTGCGGDRKYGDAGTYRCIEVQMRQNLKLAHDSVNPALGLVEADQPPSCIRMDVLFAFRSMHVQAEGPEVKELEDLTRPVC